MSTRTFKEEFLRALQAFIEAKDLVESKRIVQLHASLLLTDDADRTLVVLIRDYAEDANTALMLEQHRTLLQLCRRKGIEDAFASIARPQHMADNLSDILQALRHPARSLAERPRRVELCQKALALVNRAQQPELWAVLQNDMGVNLVKTPQSDRAENLERAIDHYRQALKVRTREAFPRDWAATQNNLAAAYAERIRGDRAENLEKAIGHYQQVLKVGTREAFPEWWAATQNNLAIAYAERIRGDRAENLEKAIGHFQQVFKVGTREAFPEGWAMTQYNLANAYAERIRGEHAENLEHAISHYQQALKVRTREAFPEEWADTQARLGTAYAEGIHRDRTENLERAIDHYQQALKVRTRKASPEKWVETQYNLANAYAERIRGERDKNLAHAIDHYQQALKVHTREAFPEEWADTQARLGTAYAEGTHRDRTENLEKAIDHYQQALKVRTRKAFPEKWAETQNNLANAYAERIRGERDKNLAHAIDHYQQALKVRTRKAFPEKWAETQYNLANAYAERIRGEHAENLEHAISHYQQALKVRTRKAFPEEWATTQNNLAVAYTERIRGKRDENLEHAINHSQQALKVHTHKAFPEEWATTQNNLATAYTKRIRGDRAENLEQAIGHYQQALKVHTHKAFPEEWATTQNNLATAYTKRIRGDRAENLEQAIGHCQQALEVRTRKVSPEKWAKTQNNLALTYATRIRGDRAENLEHAISHYQQALAVYTRETFPEWWAMTQNNLALTYATRIRGDRAENLEKAIGLCQQALKVRTRQAFPEWWAMTQNNLALTYANRIRGDRAENVEQAIGHYQQALEVYKRETFPAEHRQTQRNLGNLHFEQHNWSHALKAYQISIVAGDDLLASAYSETGRKAEVGETAQLFANSSYCLLQSHQYGEALIMLERGKTRLLVEALVLADLDVLSLPKQYRAMLQGARQTIKALEAEIRLRTDLLGTGDPEGPSPAAQLREKRAELATLIETIRQDYPGFMPIGLDLPSILALIPLEGALVAPVFTPEGSAVFVIPHGATEVTQDHVIQLDDFKEDELHAMLRGSEKEPGWLWAYQTYYNTRHLKNWQEAIASLTKRLWQTLIEPIHERLSALSAKRVLLLPSGGLQLLPLHAAWIRDEDGQKHTLLDDYEITYAPSAYALEIANRRATTRRTTARTGHTALVVGINDYKNLSKLNNAVPEAESIAQVLGTKSLLNTAATTSAIKSGAAGTAYLHLSCHGSFNWDNPMRSALYFAQDEPLRLPEIISELDLSSALLVTLSACETGISDVRQSPDEYLGLPAGFLQAGAPAIVSSLWTVDDRSTALLMERFYRNHIDRGLTSPGALREAQLWLRKATRKELSDYYKDLIRMSTQEALEASIDISVSGAPDEHPYSNPFYWAAFTFNGSNI